MFRFSTCLIATSLLFSCWISTHAVHASNRCQPITWAGKRGLFAAPTHGPPHKPRFTPSVPRRLHTNSTSFNSTIPPGEVSCQYWGHTEDEVNYYSCTQLANFYDVPLEDIFRLNPSVYRNCSNLRPNTEYCVLGFVQPNYNMNSTCGPPFGNASCPQDSQNSCCNARTWRCGGADDDCSWDNCWAGDCPGHTVYSLDGSCGSQNGGLLCTGQWGSCCDRNGSCGNGTDFCGAGNCQSGSCEQATNPSPSASLFNGTSLDGTCGGTNNYTCGVVYGSCCNAAGRCGDLPADCAISSGCQPNFGSCNNNTLAKRHL